MADIPVQCMLGIVECLKTAFISHPVEPARRRRYRRTSTPINDAVRGSVKRTSEGALNLSGIRLHKDPTRRIGTTYCKIGRLGQGAFGSVFQVKHKNTGQERAMKILSKSNVCQNPKLVMTELEALLHLDHPNVVRFYELFEEPEYICFVTEFCDRGDFNLLRGGKCPVEEMRLLFRDVTAGVSYCHGRGLAHRDLKFDNCLLCAGPKRRVGKVIDFGLSAIRHEDELEEWLEDRCGTLFFCAPEVLAGSRYGVKCDMWSLGVMLYTFLCGEFPFAEKAQRMVTKLVMREILEADIRKEPLDRVEAAPLARELVSLLLVRDPAIRIGACDALEHSWLAGARELGSAEYCVEETAQGLVSQLIAYSRHSVFEKTALMIVAQQASDDDVEEPRAAFFAFDASREGSLSKGDLRNVFATCGRSLSEEDLNVVFESLDVDRNERVGWAEWLSATVPAHVIRSEQSAKEVFNFFDADGNDNVSLAELRHVVGDIEAENVMKLGGVKRNAGKADENLPDDLAGLGWPEFKGLVGQIASARCRSRREGCWSVTRGTPRRLD